MRAITFSVLLFISILSTISCKSTKTSGTNNTEMTNHENNIFPKGNQGPAEYFTGTVWVTPLLARDSINNFSIGNVVFEPGARANWHTHPRGQVLIVTDGQGFYQEKGKPAQSIKKGDVVNIPPNVEHWHGASKDSRLVHIAITNFEGDEYVIWLAPVTDEEYKEVN